jgi:hypothetical protein
VPWSSWVAKESGKHRGIITRTAESVFGALLYLTEKYGRVFPSLEGLAHLAMCCKQSVVTAVADLQALGFVTRIRRLRRIPTPLGFTTRQITNAYRIHEATSGLGLAIRCRICKSAASRSTKAEVMSRSILGPFLTFHKGASIIGRLLAGYTNLEVGLMHCVQVVRDDFDAVLKAMFRPRGETSRIDIADALGRHRGRAANSPAR